MIVIIIDAQAVTESILVRLGVKMGYVIIGMFGALSLLASPFRVEQAVIGMCP